MIEMTEEELANMPQFTIPDCEWIRDSTVPKADGFSGKGNNDPDIPWHNLTWNRSVQACCNKNPQDKVMLICFGSWMRTVLLPIYYAWQIVFIFIVQGAWWEVPGRVYSYLYFKVIFLSLERGAPFWNGKNRKAYCKPLVLLATS